jgi:hypothetical protein
LRSDMVAAVTLLEEQVKALAKKVAVVALEE